MVSGEKTGRTTGHNTGIHRSLKWMLLFASSFDEIHIPIGRKGVGEDLDTGIRPLLGLEGTDLETIGWNTVGWAGSAKVLVGGNVLCGESRAEGTKRTVS